MWSSHLLCIFYLIFNCNTDEISYDKWCKKGELFKPYLTIYQSRLGEEIDGGGPKFYATSHHINIYVCLNGPAWLYFARQTPIGDVFHEPQFTVFEHECQAFNGRPGPGSHQDPIKLMGIYLLGQEEDYRLPSINLFTAPLYNNNTGYYENTTSIMTINNQQCTITRGKDTIITVDPNPLDRHSYCKMPYQEIGYLYNRTPPAGVSAPLAGVSPELVKDLLKNDDSLIAGECKSEESQDDVKLEKWLSELNVSRLDLYTNMNTAMEKLKTIPVDLLPLPDDITTKITAVVGRNTTAYNNMLATSTAEDNATNWAEIQKVEIEHEKLQCLLYASNLKQHAVGAFPGVNDTWNTFESLFKDGGTLFTQHKMYFEARQKYMDALDLYNKDKNPTTTTDLETANNTYFPYIKSYSDELKKTRGEFLKQETLAKNLLENVQHIFDGMKLCDRLNPKKKFVPPKVFNSTVLEISQNTKYNETDGIVTDNCFPLPKVETSCSAAKPYLVRACHFLKAITEGPDICQRDELKIETNPPPLTPVDDLIGPDFVELMDLIEDIFVRACPRLEPNFARRVNRIFKCYVIKPSANGGAGFDIRKTGPGTDDYKKNTEFIGMWLQIKQALINCKAQKPRMRFQRDPTDDDPLNYKLIIKNGTGKSLKDIFIHQEQADLQFPFNFAIDMHFKMMATVMGLCMSTDTYVTRNSLMTSEFFAKYTELFFVDLETEWTDPRDNRIFNLILGNYKNGAGGFWAERCMEASFIHSEDINFRPPRKIYVNSQSEGNFFINGKLANSQGIYRF